MLHRTLLQEWYSRVWEDGDIAAIDALFAPEMHAEGLMSDSAIGPEDFKELVPAFLALTGPLKVSIDRAVETGDWIAAHLTFTADGADRFPPAAVTGQVMMRVSGGRIVEAYNHVDFIGFFEQIGLMPEDTLLLCLSRVGI